MANKIIRLDGEITNRKGLLPLSAFQVPSDSALRYVGCFGAGQDVAARNLRTGVLGEWSGDPVDNTSHIFATGSAYLDTKRTEYTSMTIVAAVRFPNADNAALLGSYVSAADAGVALYRTPGSTTRIRLSMGGSTGAQQTIQVDYTTGSWEVVSARIPANGNAILKAHIVNNTATIASAPGRKTTGVPILIGTLYSTGFGGGADVSSVLVYEGDIGETATAAAALWAKEYAESCGITF